MSLALDSSVVVKWFKKGEELEDEALRLRNEILSSGLKAVASELMPLEVCRALIKAGYEKGKVNEAYATLKELFEYGFIEPVSVKDVRDEAEELLSELGLHVIDAINLATAIVSSTSLLTEDRHLLKRKVKELMEREGLKVVSLREFIASRR